MLNEERRAVATYEFPRYITKELLRLRSLCPATVALNYLHKNDLY